MFAKYLLLGGKSWQKYNYSIQLHKLLFHFEEIIIFIKCHQFFFFYKWIKVIRATIRSRFLFEFVWEFKRFERLKINFYSKVVFKFQTLLLFVMIPAQRKIIFLKFVFSEIISLKVWYMYTPHRLRRDVCISLSKFFEMFVPKNKTKKNRGGKKHYQKKKKNFLILLEGWLREISADFLCDLFYYMQL